jgi:hypothetical protein
MEMTFTKGNRYLVLHFFVGTARLFRLDGFQVINFFEWKTNGLGIQLRQVGGEC